jgi:hypothetical protein
LVPGCGSALQQLAVLGSAEGLLGLVGCSGLGTWIEVCVLQDLRAVQMFETGHSKACIPEDRSGL